MDIRHDVAMALKNVNAQKQPTTVQALLADDIRQ
jgi:hypothetical protein